MFLYDVQGRIVEHFIEGDCDSTYPLDKRNAEACVSVSTGQKVDECTNKNDQCPYWVKKGECQKNPKYMLKNCQKGCEVCSCKSSPIPEYTACKKAESICDEKIPSDKKTVPAPEICKNVDKETVSNCADTGKHCEYWKSQGECDKNKKYMKEKCMKACSICSCKVEGTVLAPDYVSCKNSQK